MVNPKRGVAVVVRVRFNNAACDGAGTPAGRFITLIIVYIM